MAQNTPFPSAGRHVVHNLTYVPRTHFIGWSEHMPQRSYHLEIFVAVLILVGNAVNLAAQERTPTVQTADVGALSRLVDEQRKLLETQGRLIEELTRRLDDTSRAVAASQQRLSDLERRAAGEAPQVEQRGELGQHPQRLFDLGELPLLRLPSVPSRL
jgi:hypothetical protein